MTEARIYRTPRGTFRLFPPDPVPIKETSCHHRATLDLERGSVRDHASEADAISWMETGLPEPLPLREPTEAELADAEAADLYASSGTGYGAIDLGDR